MSGSFFRLCLPGLIALSLALGVLTLPESSRAEEPPAPAISEAAVRAADEATIRQLTEQWFAAWSPGLGPVNWEAMAQLFVPGAGNLLVFDDAGGRVVVLDSWTDYRKTWEPFMAQFARWQIEPEGDIRVIVAGDLAWIIQDYPRDELRSQFSPESQGLSLKTVCDQDSCVNGPFLRHERASTSSC